nr:hypothetical protein CFP56_02683 [Quercus suber]
MLRGLRAMICQATPLGHSCHPDNEASTDSILPQVSHSFGEKRDEGWQIPSTALPRLRIDFDDRLAREVIGNSNALWRRTRFTKTYRFVRLDTFFSARFFSPAVRNTSVWVWRISMGGGKVVQAFNPSTHVTSRIPSRGSPTSIVQGAYA